MSDKDRVSDFITKKPHKSICESFSKIVAYPQNYVKDIANIMRDVQIEIIPVFYSPWNKKQVGFIELKDISSFLND
ncbi:hypothetical protein KBA27_06650 [bacterium]|nr:hypothetical protein [bacterium]